MSKSRATWDQGWFSNGIGSFWKAVLFATWLMVIHLVFYH